MIFFRFLLRCFISCELKTRFSVVEACKKWTNCALWAKNLKFGTNVVFGQAILKLNRNQHFDPL